MEKKKLLLGTDLNNNMYLASVQLSVVEPSQGARHKSGTMTMTQTEQKHT